MTILILYIHVNRLTVVYTEWNFVTLETILMRSRVVKFARIMVSLAVADDIARGLRCYSYSRSPRILQKAQSQEIVCPGGLGVPLVDIGANMLDPMFQGIYRDKERHPADLQAVLERALSAGVCKLMVTAGTLQESHDALKFCQASFDKSPQLCCTIGVHPTRCSEFEASPDGPESYLQQLLLVAKEAGNCCAAVGECGLDYDRLQFCPRDVQLRYFERQLFELAIPLQKPLFLHCRTSEAAQDLQKLLTKVRSKLPECPGVVHSFDGSLEDAQSFIQLGFFIGINGCSLKTAENLQMVKQLPEGSILLETDAPWCGIKATHAGHGFIKTTWDEVKKPEKWEEGKCIKDGLTGCTYVFTWGACFRCHGFSVLRKGACFRSLHLTHVSENIAIPNLYSLEWTDRFWNLLKNIVALACKHGHFLRVQRRRAFLVFRAITVGAITHFTSWSSLCWSKTWFWLRRL